jgi:predicted nuclease of restriction endonuclease-like (RecB) superfamily
VAKRTAVEKKGKQRWQRRLIVNGMSMMPHSRTVLSHEPDAMLRPSGEKHTVVTMLS